jgi:hypothetical protein
MTAGRGSEDNDGHQVRATIGLAGGCAQGHDGPRKPSARQIYEFTA